MALDRSVRLPGDESAPRVARAAIDEWLSGAAPKVHADARNLVSELVTHAVRQGSPPIELSLGRDGATVRLEVVDGGGAGRESPDDWSRRIIDALAEQWGVRGDDEARVWAELPAG